MSSSASLLRSSSALALISSAEEACEASGVPLPEARAACAELLPLDTPTHDGCVLDYCALGGSRIAVEQAR